MRTLKRSKQWFEREYKYLRNAKSNMIEKTKTSESYITDYLIYDLYFDDKKSYIGSAVYTLDGTLIANYELR